MEKQNSIKEFFMKTLNGMAYGLFATLIIGTILSTIGNFFPKDANDFCNFMNTVINGGATIIKNLTGAGIGIGIAFALKKDSLKTVVLAGVGELAAAFSLTTGFVKNPLDSAVQNLTGKFTVGDPLTIYFVVIGVALMMDIVLRKKTPVDIIIIPLFGLTVGLIGSMLLRYPLVYVTYGIQWVIDEGTLAAPFFMGIIVSVVMGMALTAPISSAAIAAVALNATPELIAAGRGEGILLASGAAIIGCCCQMVGFAIQARKDNPIGMVISIGIGTSMLEFKNIIKKPIVWLPTIIASAILGPVSTCWLKLTCNGVNAGMGTAGLVGQIGTYASMGNTWQTWVGIFGFQIVAPAVLVFLLDLLFRKLNLIKDGDLKV